MEGGRYGSEFIVLHTVYRQLKDCTRYRVEVLVYIATKPWDAIANAT
jgi:hypothetical protein